MLDQILYEITHSCPLCLYFYARDFLHLSRKSYQL